MRPVSSDLKFCTARPITVSVPQGPPTQPRLRIFNCGSFLPGLRPPQDKTGFCAIHTSALESSRFRALRLSNHRLALSGLGKVATLWAIACKAEFWRRCSGATLLRKVWTRRAYRMRGECKLQGFSYASRFYGLFRKIIYYSDRGDVKS